MSLREYRFRPRTLPTLVVLCALPLLLGLGFWQLDRAAQKEQLARDLEQQRALPPLQLSGAELDRPAARYRDAMVEGRFEPDHQVFLENRRDQGRRGYQVITPLHIRGSETRVLVNRGWIPEAAAGLPKAAAPAGEVRVRGMIDVPSPPALALGNPSDWGQTWPYFTVAAYAARETFPVLPFVLLQDPGDENGFSRHWPKPDPNPWMHVGYAVQWFAFALIASVIYLRLSIESPTRNQP